MWTARTTPSSSGRKHKKQSIMTFRDNSYRSVMTGTMAPAHHTVWVDAMDDSMKSYLRND